MTGVTWLRKNPTLLYWLNKSLKCITLHSWHMLQHLLDLTLRYPMIIICLFVLLNHVLTLLKSSNLGIKVLDKKLKT